MDFFKNIIKPFKKESPLDKKFHQSREIYSDEIFVNKFIEKGGKFLYCTNLKEIIENLNLIITEYKIQKLLCYDHDLVNLTKKNNIDTEQVFTKELPFFTTREYLISNEGDIVFTSNQLNSTKLIDFSENFIVYATTSQIVKNNREAMEGINIDYKGYLPNNISNIRYYNLRKNKESFMNYGNSNSKNLYLILFEDLKK